MQWHYIKKYMSQGVQFTWKVSYLFHKVHNLYTMPLYYNPNIIFNRLQSTLKDIIVSSIHSHPVLVSLSDQLKLQAKDSNRKVKEVSSLFP